MAIFSAGLKCTNSECKNDGREDVERWELKDYLGYSCGIVCDDCYENKRRNMNQLKTIPF